MALLFKQGGVRRTILMLHLCKVTVSFLGHLQKRNHDDVGREIPIWSISGLVRFEHESRKLPVVAIFCRVGDGKGDGQRFRRIRCQNLAADACPEWKLWEPPIRHKFPQSSIPFVVLPKIYPKMFLNILSADVFEKFRLEKYSGKYIWQSYPGNLFEEPSWKVFPEKFSWHVFSLENSGRSTVMSFK